MPILVVSGEQDLAEKVTPSYNRAYLAKPFHAEDLYRQINQLLSIRRPQVPGAQG